MVLKAASSGGGGIRSPKVHLTTSEQPPNKNTTKLLQHLTLKEVTNFQIEQKQTDSQQNHDTNLHKKCATGVHQNNISPESLPADLAMVIERWPNLPQHVKVAIMALIQTTA
jgi:hypothetical protein